MKIWWNQHNIILAPWYFIVCNTKLNLDMYMYHLRMEFRKDISELRTKHPEWRYAPLKQMETEHIEPMPSRLRPRDKLKKKVELLFLFTLCPFLFMLH